MSGRRCPHCGRTRPNRRHLVRLDDGRGFDLSTAQIEGLQRLSVHWQAHDDHGVHGSTLGALDRQGLVEFRWCELAQRGEHRLTALGDELQGRLP